MNHAINARAIGQLFAISVFLLLAPRIAFGGAAPALTEAEAVRFLRQATFGPTPKLVAEVQKLGVNKFLDQQFKLRPKKYPALKFYPESRPRGCSDNCERDNYTYYLLQRHFFSNALTGRDQLRQRVAYSEPDLCDRPKQRPAPCLDENVPAAAL